MQEKENLPWRSWWDGAGGPIVRQWNVEGLPTLFLIDHKGKVRYETVGVPDVKELDGQIEQLVKEAAAG